MTLGREEKQGKKAEGRKERKAECVISSNLDSVFYLCFFLTASSILHAFIEYLPAGPAKGPEEITAQLLSSKLVKA